VQAKVFDSLTGEGELTVLGQTVRFNKQTVFRGVTREAIAVGDDVAISGWLLDSGEFLASLVRRSGIFAPGGEAEVKGIIEDSRHECAELPNRWARDRLRPLHRNRDEG
jgi:hypothetical protein